LPASTDPAPVPATPGRRLGTVAVRAGLVVAGVLVAAAGTLVARAGATIGSTSLPWGLVLTLVTTVAIARAGASIAGFGGAVAVAVGWFATVGTFALVSPGGDQLIGSDWTGVGFMGLGVVGVGAVVIREMARPLRR
jgi:hypothetical protein